MSDIIFFFLSYRFIIPIVFLFTHWKTAQIIKQTVQYTYVLIINDINTKVVCVLDVQEEQEPGGGGGPAQEDPRRLQQAAAIHQESVHAKLVFYRGVYA